MITETTDATFQNDVLKSDLPVAVDFWAPWCGPCKLIAPIMDSIAEKVQGKAVVCKVNVDDCPKVSAKYGITAIPTVIVFEKGKPARQLVGIQKEEQYLNALLPEGLR